MKEKRYSDDWSKKQRPGRGNRSTQTLRQKNRNGISLSGTLFLRGNPSCFTILSSVNRTARQNRRSGILRHLRKEKRTVLDWSLREAG